MAFSNLILSFSFQSVKKNAALGVLQCISPQCISPHSLCGYNKRSNPIFVHSYTNADLCVTIFSVYYYLIVLRVLRSWIIHVDL